MSISLGGSVLTGIQGTLDANVAAELGFNRTSGQTLELETPSSGFIARYRITTDYNVISGRGLARLSTGKKQEISYTFQADCALGVNSREVMSCEAASKETPVAIAVLMIKSEIQADGTIKSIANLSITPLGLGMAEVTAPSILQRGESGVVRLKITPDSALGKLPQVTVTPSFTGAPTHTLAFSDTLQVYPVMSAKLIGVNFEIISDGHTDKPITSGLATEWCLNVVPKDSGQQILLLMISIPVIIDPTQNTRSAYSLKNIPIEIRVVEAPTSTPLPTPTPRPTIERIGEKLIENTPSVLAAVLVFIGTILTVFASIQNSKRQATIEHLRKEIEKGTKEKEALAREVARLRVIPWWQFWRK